MCVREGGREAETGEFEHVNTADLPHPRGTGGQGGRGGGVVTRCPTPREAEGVARRERRRGCRDARGGGGGATREAEGCRDARGGGVGAGTARRGTSGGLGGREALGRQDHEKSIASWVRTLTVATSGGLRGGGRWA